MMGNSNTFSKILTFLHLRKNRQETSDIFLDGLRGFVMFRGLSDCEADPWYSRAYWAIYRYFKYNPWGSPRRIYYKMKFTLQRARRGWADCDTWDLDHYLDG
jgi:hypothetical protein